MASHWACLSSGSLHERSICLCLSPRWVKIELWISKSFFSMTYPIPAMSVFCGNLACLFFPLSCETYNKLFHLVGTRNNVCDFSMKRCFFECRWAPRTLEHNADLLVLLIRSGDKHKALWSMMYPHDTYTSHLIKDRDATQLKVSTISLIPKTQ